jgi:hypothetical protein
MVFGPKHSHFLLQPSAHLTFQTHGWAAFQAKFEPGSQISLASVEKGLISLVKPQVKFVAATSF